MKTFARLNGREVRCFTTTKIFCNKLIYLGSGADYKVGDVLPLEAAHYRYEQSCLFITVEEGSFESAFHQVISGQLVQTIARQELKASDFNDIKAVYNQYGAQLKVKSLEEALAYVDAFIALETKRLEAAKPFQEQLKETFATLNKLRGYRKEGRSISQEMKLEAKRLKSLEEQESLKYHKILRELRDTLSAEWYVEVPLELVSGRRFGAIWTALRAGKTPEDVSLAQAWLKEHLTTHPNAVNAYMDWQAWTDSSIRDAFAADVLTQLA